MSKAAITIHDGKAVQESAAIHAELVMEEIEFEIASRFNGRLTKEAIRCMQGQIADVILHVVNVLADASKAD